MNMELRTHKVDLVLYLTEGARKQIRKQLRKDEADRADDDIEMAAQVMATCGRVMHSIRSKDIDAGKAVAAAASTAGSQGLASLISQIEMPFGSFQVAFIPELKTLVCCGGSESSAEVQMAVRAAEHQNVCKNTIHDNSCFNPGSPSTKPEKAELTNLKGILNILAGKPTPKKEEPKKEESKSESKNRLIDYLGENN